MSHTDFSLSPPPTPEDWERLRRTRYEVKQLSEEAYTNLKLVEAGEATYCNGDPIVVDFLALEEPLIKKRIQRQQQRKRPRPQPDESRKLRSSLLVCMDRAKRWMRLLDGVGPNRPWLKSFAFQDVGINKGAHGFGHNDNIDQVTVYRETLVPLNTKDEKDSAWRGYRDTNDKLGFKTLEFMEPVLSVKNSSLSTPVPEPPCGGKKRRLKTSVMTIDPDRKQPFNVIGPAWKGHRVRAK